MNEDITKYEDMLLLKVPVSKKHPRMSALDRAAQFSPFAALTGYDEEIKETARLTSIKKELSEDEISLLNARLSVLRKGNVSCGEVAIEYFLPDEKKQGGAYVKHRGIVKKVDAVLREVLFLDGVRVPMSEIYDISGECFEE